MNIRRYVAPDMRTAFKLVREELGPDVVILSTRKVKGQIELTVASDNSAASSPSTVAVKEFSIPKVGSKGSVIPDSALPAQPLPVNPIPSEAAAKTLHRSSSDTYLEMTSSSSAVNDELRALRRLLETQLAALSWNDLSRRSPAIAEIARELSEVGYSKDFIASAVERIPDGAEFRTAQAIVNASIESQLKTTGDSWTAKGGTIAIVGPAGAGKTTALAALAARWVMHNGTQGAVLISAGESRFGVHENLARVGRLVGVPVHTVSSLDEVPALLARLVDRRLVLIDTAGCGPRSDSFDTHLAALARALPGAQFALALSAASQPLIAREVIAGYRRLGDVACVMSHLDECSAIGGMLSALIENEIPVAYTMSGPRLLDDLRPARADALISLSTSTEKSTETADGRSEDNRYVA